MGRVYGGRTSDLIAIDVKIDDKRFRTEQAIILGDDMPFATALALTTLAGELKGVAQKEIKSRYDRPTRWTQNSVFTWPAKKTDWPNQNAGVYFKDYAPDGTAAGEYLHPTIVGKTRKHKRFEKVFIKFGLMKSNEYAVPGKSIKLNQYGNVSRGTLRKVMAQLQVAEATSGHTANESKASRDRKRGKNGNLRGARYFVPPDGSKLPRGVYQRTGRGPVKLLFLFVTDSPDYSVILPFKKIQNDAAKQRSRRVFDKTFDRVVADRRKRRTGR